MTGTVHTLQRHGFTINEAVKELMAEYRIKEKEAEEAVEKNWKTDAANTSEKSE